MRTRIKKKIENLQGQPEHIRMRAASTFMVVGGVALVALWLTVLLPLQLFFQRPEVAEEPAPAGQVSGAQDVSPTPTPTPTLNPFYE